MVYRSLPDFNLVIFQFANSSFTRGSSSAQANRQSPALRPTVQPSKGETNWKRFGPTNQPFMRIPWGCVPSSTRHVLVMFSHFRKRNQTMHFGWAVSLLSGTLNMVTTFQGIQKMTRTHRGRCGWYSEHLTLFHWNLSYIFMSQVYLQ